VTPRQNATRQEAELQETRRGFETQLTIASEHMIAMNDVCPCCAGPAISAVLHSPIRRYFGCFVSAAVPWVAVTLHSAELVGVTSMLPQRARSQSEAISTLEAAQVLCGRCKHWNSISWLTSAKGRNGERCEGCGGPSSFNFA
jgi:hypothetical protein